MESVYKGTCRRHKRHCCNFLTEADVTKVVMLFPIGLIGLDKNRYSVSSSLD